VNDEGCCRSLKHLTTSVLWLAYSYIPTRQFLYKEYNTTIASQLRISQIDALAHEYSTHTQYTHTWMQFLYLLKYNVAIATQLRIWRHALYSIPKTWVQLGGKTCAHVRTYVCTYICVYQCTVCHGERCLSTRSLQEGLQWNGRRAQADHTTSSIVCTPRAHRSTGAPRRLYVSGLSTEECQHSVNGLVFRHFLYTV